MFGGHFPAHSTLELLVAWPSGVSAACFGIRPSLRGLKRQSQSGQYMILDCYMEE